MHVRSWLIAGALGLAATPVLAHGFKKALAADLPALFAQADADGDGKLTLEEYKTFRALAAEKRTEAQFQRLDTAGAGVVTLDELQARIAAHAGGGHCGHRGDAKQ